MKSKNQRIAAQKNKKYPTYQHMLGKNRQIAIVTGIDYLLLTKELGEQFDKARHGRIAGIYRMAAAYYGGDLNEDSYQLLIDWDMTGEYASERFMRAVVPYPHIRNGIDSLIHHSTLGAVERHQQQKTTRLVELLEWYADENGEITEEPFKTQAEELREELDAINSERRCADIDYNASTPLWDDFYGKETQRFINELVHDPFVFDGQTLLVGLERDKSGEDELWRVAWSMPVSSPDEAITEFNVAHGNTDRGHELMANIVADWHPWASHEQENIRENQSAILRAMYRYRSARKTAELYYCDACKTPEQPNNPLEVDHIKPRSLFPELATDPQNMQLLHKACNRAKSNNDSHDWRSPAVAMLTTATTMTTTAPKSLRKMVGMRKDIRKPFAGDPQSITQRDVNTAIDQLSEHYPSITTDSLYRAKGSKLAALATLKDDSDTLAAVRLCMQWMIDHRLLVGLADYFNTSSAYSHKHSVERWASTKGEESYISMMSFVIAAWIAGLENTTNRNPRYRFDERKLSAAAYN